MKFRFCSAVLLIFFLFLPISGKAIVLHAETLRLSPGSGSLVFQDYLILESGRTEGKYLDLSEETPGVLRYSSGTLPDALKSHPKMYTLKVRFLVSESLRETGLALCAGISEYPFRIYLNGIELYVRGRYLGSHYNSSLRLASSVYLSKNLLVYGSPGNELVVELYPTYEVWAFDKLWIDSTDRVASAVFWRNFFGINIVQATLLMSFVLCIYFAAIFLLEKRRNIKHLYFAVICMTFCLAYFNMLVHHEAIDEIPLEAVSKAALVFGAPFLFVFCCSYTGIFLKYRDRTRRLLLAMPLIIGLTSSLFIVLQPTKQRIIESFNVFMNLIIMPHLLLAMIVLGFAFIGKKNTHVIPLLISFIAIFATAVIDISHMNRNVLPYVWLFPYGYFSFVVATFVILVLDQTRQFHESLQKTADLTGSNARIEGFVMQLSAEKAERDINIRMLESSAKENANLLHELQHRVYNNLQIIQSMLGLQKSRLSGDSKWQIAKAYARVSVISRMFDFLVEARGISTVRLDCYIESIAHFANEADDHGMEIFNFKFEMDQVSVNPDDATLIAMVFNELVSNAIERVGDSLISVGLGAADGSIRMSVEYDCDARMHVIDDSRSLGLTLADVVAVQLDGKLIRVDGDSTVRFDLVCPYRVNSDN